MNNEKSWQFVAILKDDIVQKLESEKEKSFDKDFYREIYNAVPLAP